MALFYLINLINVGKVRGSWMLACSACHGKLIAPVTLRYSRVEALRIRNPILTYKSVCRWCSDRSSHVLVLFVVDGPHPTVRSSIQAPMRLRLGTSEARARLFLDSTHISYKTNKVYLHYSIP